MKIKKIYTTTLLCILAIDSLARAGGGSGVGGGYRFGRGIAGLIALLIFLGLLYYRTRQSKIQIKKSQIVDPTWEYDELVAYVKEIYVKMQTAWMNKNLENINDLITEKLRVTLEKEIHHLNFINETNYIEDIQIKSVRIIACEDHIDNNQDSFTAYLRGRMIDYSVSGRTGNITRNSSKSHDRFSDLLYFQKHEKKWLLDKIDNEVRIKDLYRAKHIIE